MSLSPAASDPTFESDPRFADPIAAAPSVNRGDNAFWGEDGLQFGDVLDSINPLQHIPVVSSIYRKMTGDELAPGARIAGGSLFGGPVGFLSGLFNSAIEGATGKDIGGYVLGLLPGGDAPPTAPALRVAAAEPTPANTPPSAGTEQVAQTSAAPPTNDNTLALAALQRDLRLTSSAVRPTPSQASPSDNPTKPTAAAEEPPRTTFPTRPSGQAGKNIFAVPLPPTSGTTAGPTQSDGRKAGEYSAAELASILRAYQRAGDAAPPEISRAPRVED
jgi:hypothetical protein